MSLSSFLTQSPVNYAQGASQTSSSLPQWYTDYTQGILNNAAQFANQGYQAYPGPQVAGLTADQNASYKAVGARTGVSGVTGNMEGADIAKGALGQPNAAQAANPYLGQANQGIQSALQGPNASTAAQPFMQAAGQPLSQQMGQFMNPYINDVVNATNKISSRNFNENVMPGLQDQFTRAGQVYGGTRQGEFAERMGRDEQLNQQMTDASLLSSGFNTALGGAQAQAGINSGLAGTAATAANAAQGNALYGSGLTAGLGSTAGSLANASQQTGLAGAQTVGGLGTAQQQSALQQATLLNQMGTQQQQQQQNNLNTQYQNFQNQTQFPALASQVMGSALQGIQVPSSTTNYQTQPYGLGSTGFQNLAGGVGLGSQIGDILGPYLKARGGAVNLAKGGPANVRFLPSVKPTLGLKMRYRSPLLT